MRALERLAISQRLDLQADYLQVTSQVKNLGLTKSFRLVGALDFGVNSERETDAQTRTGPTFAIELPIFNQGQARIARGEAALRQSQDKFEALAVDVRSQIRELRDELTSKREIARFYQDELLPGQRRILNEVSLTITRWISGILSSLRQKLKRRVPSANTSMPSEITGLLERSSNELLAVI
jgi:cobalt-zinc-cadmium efflux system outer membrane protein